MPDLRGCIIGYVVAVPAVVLSVVTVPVADLICLEGTNLAAVAASFHEMEHMHISYEVCDERSTDKPRDFFLALQMF